MTKLLTQLRKIYKIMEFDLKINLTNHGENWVIINYMKKKKYCTMNLFDVAICPLIYVKVNV